MMTLEEVTGMLRALLPFIGSDSRVKSTLNVAARRVAAIQIHQIQ